MVRMKKPRRLIPSVITLGLKGELPKDRQLNGDGFSIDHAAVNVPDPALLFCFSSEVPGIISRWRSLSRRSALRSRRS